MTINTIRNALIILLCCFCKMGMGSAHAFFDPLHEVAKRNVIGTPVAITAMAANGNTLIAVGQRGYITVSEDGGQKWRQADVPVSVDLTSVFLVSESIAWVTGHDGVILGTQNGGKSWIKHIDGNDVNRLLSEFYKSGPLSTIAADYNLQGSDKPFLDIWFDNENDGFVVGAYGLILQTKDGGKNWKPWLHKISNDKLLHLYSVRRINGTLYVVGEQGFAQRLESEEKGFQPISVPYNGTFFGLIGNDSSIYLFGLRGTILTSRNKGASWEKVSNMLPAGIVAGALLGKTEVLFAAQDGRVISVDQQNLLVTKVTATGFSPASAIAFNRTGWLFISGQKGVEKTNIQRQEK